MILEDKNKIFLAPNGDGGCFPALAKYKLVSQMKDTGITHVQIVGVDNVLAKIGDPYFLGYAEMKNYDITCKYVEKVSILLWGLNLMHLFKASRGIG